MILCMWDLHLVTKFCSKKLCGLHIFIFIHKGLFLHRLSRLSHPDGWLASLACFENGAATCHVLSEAV